MGQDFNNKTRTSADGPELNAKVLVKMVLTCKKNLYQDNVDAVLGIIKSHFWEKGDEFQQHVNLAVEKIPTINNSLSFRCSKVSLSIWAVENGKAGGGWGWGGAQGASPHPYHFMEQNIFIYKIGKHKSFTCE